jgi:uncharacterized membrane protein (UPF0136 family)
VIDSLAASITVLALAAAVTVLGQLARHRYRWRHAVPILVGFEVAALGQAVCAIGGLVDGHQAREPGTLVAYLIVSTMVLPAAAALVRGDDGGWSAVVVAAALVVLAVVTIRAQTTWRVA